MAFGIDIKGMMTKMDDRFQQLIAKLDEILAETRKQRGGVPLAVMILAGLIVILLIGLGLCGDALLEDEDERNDLGQARVELADHEYGGGYDEGGYGGRYDECDPSWDDCYGDSYRNDYSSRDRQRNQRRNRGAFSPGPFQDSPVTIIICPPGTQYCGSDGGRGDQPPPERGGYA